MSKHSKLYEKSPKLERNEDGDMEVKAGKDETIGEDGSSAEDDGEVKSKDPHEEERKAMHKRHEEEQKAMHERHHKDMKEMHKRHEASGDKTGGEEISKIEKEVE